MKIIKEVFFIYRKEDSRFLFVDHCIRTGKEDGINTEYTVDSACSAPGFQTRQYSSHIAHQWQIKERIDSDEDMVYIPQ